MTKSEFLTTQPSAKLIGLGFALTMLGGVIFAISLPLSLDADASASIFFVLLSGAALIAGSVCTAMGITRIAAKIDDAHKLFVTRRPA